MNATEKTLAILEAVARAGGPHRLAEVSAQAEVGKPSAHRILQDLVRNGFVSMRNSGSYVIGARLLSLASEILGGSEETAFVPVLEELSSTTGHTVHLAVRSGLEAVYVHKINADRPYKMASAVGMRIPLHCTAIGKCILASLSPEEAAQTIPRLALVARTPHTIVSREALLRELVRVTQQGYAIDNEENEENVRCIGAPVTGTSGAVLAGLSVSTLSFEMGKQDIAGLAPFVMASAARLSALRAHTGI